MLKKQERTYFSLLFFISGLLSLKYSRLSDISILTVLSKLPSFLNEPDLSKAIILFFDNAINAITEFDKRTAWCEETLKAILGQQTHDRTEWQ